MLHALGGILLRAVPTFLLIILLHFYLKSIFFKPLERVLEARSEATEGARDETKARYAFVYGDFRRVHRSGLIACVYRASEWRHKAVELAAHDLLQLLDAQAGLA